MNFLSGQGAEEPTVYGWNTKVSAPFFRHAFFLETYLWFIFLLGKDHSNGMVQLLFLLNLVHLLVHLFYKMVGK